MFTAVDVEVKRLTDKRTDFVLTLLRETDVPWRTNRRGWIACCQIEGRKMERQLRFEETSRLRVAKRQQIVSRMTATWSAK